MSEYKDTAVFTMAALASSMILQPHDFEPATTKRHSEVENCAELHAWRAEVFDKEFDIYNIPQHIDQQHNND